MRELGESTTREGGWGGGGEIVYCSYFSFTNLILLLQRAQEDEYNGILFDIVDLSISSERWILREE